MLPQMLALRDWSVSLLAGRGGDISPRLWQTIESSPHHVWGHFLALERCAHPLNERLAAWRKKHDSQPLRSTSQLRTSATAELQRALSAARQLRTIGATALSEGWPCVVLKGGVPAANGNDFLDLHDVDVLVRPEHLPLATAALARAGYAAAPVAARPYHLAPRTAAESLPVEVHTSIARDGTPPPDELWERIEPIASAPGTFRLAASDHLWHVLTHSALDHPYRVSRLRDALLVGQALGLCSPAEQAAVSRRIESHPERARLRAGLALAEVVCGRRSDIADPLRSVAASDYLASIVARHRLCPTEMHEMLTLCTAAIHAGRPHRRKLWAASFSRDAAAPHALVSWLEKPFPRLGTRLRVGLRLARLAVAMPLAHALVGIARAEARRGNEG